MRGAFMLSKFRMQGHWNEVAGAPPLACAFVYITAQSTLSELQLNQGCICSLAARVQSLRRSITH
jgi:hypothetical protein